MVLLIFYLILAILISFLCSILEAVILSVTPSYISIKLQAKKSYALQLKKFKDNIDKPLAGILTLNTFAHTIGAAGVGAQAQLIWGHESLSITSVILTLLILILSEIIPKTIGATHWKSLVPFSVFAIRTIVFILYPFVILSQYVTRFFKKDGQRSVLSRYEVSAMAEIGAKQGVFKSGESRIIQNIARFDKLQTRDIMTPRPVIFAASENEKIGKFYRQNPSIRFSRIPIFDKNIDDLSAYFLKDDLLIEIISKRHNKELKSIKRELPVVFEGLPIPELFNVLMGKNEHIAAVVDEYGVTAGIVTMEDVIETILGMEILDELDNIADLQKTARQRWKERARRMGMDIEDED
ncbi:MAG: CNNM domain-containing protein [Bacteroidota bacterium]|nr:CNNM domain-containing protein [Bacteroidota bacterium]